MRECYISHHAGACLLRFFARKLHCTACVVWTEGLTSCYSAVEYSGPKGSVRGVADDRLYVWVSRAQSILVHASRTSDAGKAPPS